MGDGDDMGTCGCRPAAVRSRMGGGPLDLKDTRGRTLCSTLAREVTVRRRDTPSAATTATATTPFLSASRLLPIFPPSSPWFLLPVSSTRSGT
jgi:hypothetical protein